MEDYLERIYKLEEKKGYARVVDIAESLDFAPSSVTRMVQRLADEGYLEYERYRGIILTDKGRELGRRMSRRHESLDEFLRMIGVADEDTLWRDVEGIEHHVSPETMAAIRSLTAFLKSDGACYKRLRAFQKEQGVR
jgi:Mn-dependent DtxR family transcriptional regulator